MARETNQRVEDYWAGQLARSELLRNMLGATNVQLIDRSLHRDPPDALFEVSYRDGESKKLWCEISGAWRSRKGAREVFEVVEGKRPPPSGPHGVMAEPDARTADSVIRAILKKLGKDTYRELISDHGPGHLHIFLSSDHYPLFDRTTLSGISSRLPVEELEDRALFRSVSLGYHDQLYSLWPMAIC